MNLFRSAIYFPVFFYFKFSYATTTFDDGIKKYYLKQRIQSIECWFWKEISHNVCLGIKPGSNP